MMVIYYHILVNDGDRLPFWGTHAMASDVCIEQRPVCAGGRVRSDPRSDTNCDWETENWAPELKCRVFVRELWPNARLMLVHVSQMNAMWLIVAVETTDMFITHAVDSCWWNSLWIGNDWQWSMMPLLFACLVGCGWARITCAQHCLERARGRTIGCSEQWLTPKLGIGTARLRIPPQKSATYN